MNLGALTDLLAALDPAKPVRFSDGRIPDEFISWRGVYAELSLTSGAADCTVGELLDKAQAADGATFQGYKGGDFTMDRTTPVWADEWGECSFDAITAVGVVLNGEAVTLVVTNIGEYR